MFAFRKMFAPAIVACGTVIGAASPARAADPLGSFELANALGDLIASENFCGLKYDQDAIQRFIRTRVGEDDMGFTSNLTGMVTVNKFTQAQMSPSAKTAHCAQVERVARHYGFIK